MTHAREGLFSALCHEAGAGELITDQTRLVDCPKCIAAMAAVLHEREARSDR